MLESPDIPILPPPAGPSALLTLGEVFGSILPLLHSSVVSPLEKNRVYSAQLHTPILPNVHYPLCQSVLDTIDHVVNEKTNE